MFTKATCTLALLCSSVLGAALPYSDTSLVKRTDCQPGSQVVNGVLYTLSCGVNRPGGDYGSVQTLSWQGCVDACTSDSQCVSATYHYDSGFCYLKNTLTWEGDSSEFSENTVVLGTGCQARDRDINGRQCSVVCGTDYHGGDYGQQRAESFEACAQACAADAQCVTAQYRDSTGWCYLKSTVGSDVTSDSDVDSIMCPA